MTASKVGAHCIAYAGAVTAIIRSAVTAGSVRLVALIVAAPGVSAVTTPVALTDATAGAELVKSSVGSAPGSAVTFVAAVAVRPTVSEAGSVIWMAVTRGVLTLNTAVAAADGLATLVAVIVL